MNALFLKDLAQKTRRGLEGRVRQGRSGGGLCFGYDVVRAVDASGEPVAGGRTINEAEAAVVRRIFAEYAQGRPPRAIARGLNADRIPGPFGGTWGPSTINGNAGRGTGILNNALYLGRLVWNRLRYCHASRLDGHAKEMNTARCVPQRTNTTIIMYINPICKSEPPHSASTTRQPSQPANPSLHQDHAKRTLGVPWGGSWGRARPSSQASRAARRARSRTKATRAFAWSSTCSSERWLLVDDGLADL
jgi:hypothetical protein